MQSKASRIFVTTGCQPPEILLNIRAPAFLFTKGLYSKRQKEGCTIARFITGKLWPFVIMIPTVIRASRSKDTGRKATYTRHTAGYDRA